ncbi:aldo/keto reductase [Streptomyces sp. NBC_00654]|uniref:aldo/keto reductase n=1 Tax=Streptomyces sp. NBC_00654 TaxID=2975799 RepID=UPI00224DB4B2|nr:aldo/keto reductase [Streptomyces sp. NBC_00654]MCX4968029.1 aldo/keto reductase [Streptomyces sp. NBC_00654]
MSVEKRPLGVTGMSITTLGLGTWALGGPDWLYGWSSQDDRESIATIRRSPHAGVNWIDTAAVYGLGHSVRTTANATDGGSALCRRRVSRWRSTGRPWPT